MAIDFEKTPEELGNQVRAILGVPQEFLTDEVISSPVFLKQAETYINKKISEYTIKQGSTPEELLKIGYIYYVCYLLCLGMYARLPKQMDNVNTKTILLSIDWNQMALDMLDRCDEIVDNALEDFQDEDINYGNTYAVLTDASEYPNTTI
jgi:hypothetical protein